MSGVWQQAGDVQRMAEEGVSGKVTGVSKYTMQGISAKFSKEFFSKKPLGFVLGAGGGYGQISAHCDCTFTGFALEDSDQNLFSQKVDPNETKEYRHIPIFNVQAGLRLQLYRELYLIPEIGFNTGLLVKSVKLSFDPARPFSKNWLFGRKKKVLP